jgi:hypothetical protein
VVCLCVQRRKAEADKRRPSASQRGYDREWQKASSAYLTEPANQYCECGALARWSVTSSVSGNVLTFAWSAQTGSPVADAAMRATPLTRLAMLKGERQLWCAVIAQAIEDATAPLSESLRKRREQVRAREWFIEADKDFQRACDLAGYDPERIRIATMELIEAVKPHDPKPRQQQPRLQKNALHHHEGRSLTIQEWV